MEQNFVIPEASTYDLIFSRFGRASQPVRKARELAFWLRRFSFHNPFALHGLLPTDDADVARLLLKRITAPRYALLAHIYTCRNLHIRIDNFIIIILTQFHSSSTRLSQLTDPIRKLSPSPQLVHLTPVMEFAVVMLRTMKDN